MDITSGGVPQNSQPITLQLPDGTTVTGSWEQLVNNPLTSGLTMGTLSQQPLQVAATATAPAVVESVQSPTLVIGASAPTELSLDLQIANAISIEQVQGELASDNDLVKSDKKSDFYTKGHVPTPITDPVVWLVRSKDGKNPLPYNSKEGEIHFAHGCSSNKRPLRNAHKPSKAGDLFAIKQNAMKGGYSGAKFDKDGKFLSGRISGTGKFASFWIGARLGS